MDITLDLVRRVLQARSPARVDEPDALQAAVAAVLAPGSGSGLDLLLLKRAEHPRDPWSGQMGLPGGRQDPGDGDLLATAIRECREETSVSVARDNLLGQLDDVHPRTPQLPPIVVRPFVFGLAAKPTVSLNEESEISLWVSLGELKEIGSPSSVEVRGRRLDVFGYQLGPHLVWGLTERIVTPLLNLIFDSRLTGS